MSIDYQSKRRDVRTAAHHWRCNGWARRKSFCWEGKPQQSFRITTNTSQRTINLLKSRPTSISASPLLLRSIGALYCTTPIQYVRLQEARDKPLHPPTFQKSLIHRLLRPLIHPPLLFNSLDPPHAVYYPPLFTKDLGWGPRRRHLALITTVPLFCLRKVIQDWIHASCGKAGLDYTRRYKNKIGLYYK